jgi:hypothetical protein
MENKELAIRYIQKMILIIQKGLYPEVVTPEDAEAMVTLVIGEIPYQEGELGFVGKGKEKKPAPVATVRQRFQKQIEKFSTDLDQLQKDRKKAKKHAEIAHYDEKIKAKKKAFFELWHGTISKELSQARQQEEPIRLANKEKARQTALANAEKAAKALEKATEEVEQSRLDLEAAFDLHAIAEEKAQNACQAADEARKAESLAKTVAAAQDGKNGSNDAVRVAETLKAKAEREEKELSNRASEKLKNRNKLHHEHRVKVAHLEQMKKTAATEQAKQEAREKAQKKALEKAAKKAKRRAEKKVEKKEEEPSAKPAPKSFNIPQLFNQVYVEVDKVTRPEFERLLRELPKNAKLTQQQANDLLEKAQKNVQKELVSVPLKSRKKDDAPNGRGLVVDKIKQLIESKHPLAKNILPKPAKNAKDAPVKESKTNVKAKPSKAKGKAKQATPSDKANEISSDTTAHNSQDTTTVHEPNPQDITTVHEPNPQDITTVHEPNPQDSDNDESESVQQVSTQKQTKKASKSPKAHHKGKKQKDSVIVGCQKIELITSYRNRLLLDRCILFLQDTFDACRELYYDPRFHPILSRMKLGKLGDFFE